MLDVAFFHPPTSFDKLRLPHGGVFSAQVVSSDLLEHEPAGMIAMARDLVRRGVQTRVFNVGRMLQQVRLAGGSDPGPVKAQVAAVQARIFAVGLHWAAHAPGALELARLLKASHPHSTVLLGGISATYFHQEILDTCPAVDLVLLGELDGIMPRLVQGLLDRRPLAELPNLAFRGADGQVERTALQRPIKAGQRYVAQPGSGLVQPEPAALQLGGGRAARVAFVPLIHGCVHACSFCGGGRGFYAEHFGRRAAEALPVADVLENLKDAASAGVGQVWLMGDPRAAGQTYWQQLSASLATLGLDLELYVEAFEPAPEAVLRGWRAATTGRVTLAFSPESGDLDVRRRLDKGYADEVISQQLEQGQQLGLDVALGFTFPLPGQDLASVARTLALIERLCRQQDRLISYMFEPFVLLDPGSPIYEDPAAHGYTWEHDRSLAALVQALGRPHWYQGLSYHTRWLSRRQLARAIFEVGCVRNELAVRYLGPSPARWFHHQHLEQQRQLVRQLQQQPELDHQGVAQLAARLPGADQGAGSSVTAPDFEHAQQADGRLSLSQVFSRAARAVARSAVGHHNTAQLLAAFDAAELFAAVDQLTAAIQALRQAGPGQGAELAAELAAPAAAARCFDALRTRLAPMPWPATLELLMAQDWACHVMTLYMEHHLAPLLARHPAPAQVSRATVLLPPASSYVATAQDPQLVISHHGVACQLDAAEADLLRGCGWRLPLMALYGAAMELSLNPTPMVNSWIERGVVLLAAEGFGA